MAQFDRFWKPAVENREVGAFLRTQTDIFREDLSQQPSFDEGFKALRRNQMIKLARKYRQPLNEDMPGMDMIAIFHAWWMQGIFHQQPVHEPKPLTISEEMRTAPGIPLPSGMPADPIPGNNEQRRQLKAMKWGELKAHARDLNLPVTNKMKRPEVEALILG